MITRDLENVGPVVKGLFDDSCAATLADGSVWTFGNPPFPIAEFAPELPISARDSVGADFGPSTPGPCCFTHLGVEPSIPGGTPRTKPLWGLGGPIVVLSPPPAPDLRARFCEARAEMAIALVRWLDSGAALADSALEIEWTCTIARAFGQLAADVR